MLTLATLLTIAAAFFVCVAVAGSRPGRRAPQKPETASVTLPRREAREARHGTPAPRERRTYLAKVETRALTAAEKTAGYIGALTGIIPLNTDSVALRDRSLNSGQPFVERIAPKTFDLTADIIAVVGHTDDPLAAVARTGANLTLTESATELRWDALLPDTTAGRDLAELGAKNIIRGTSFEFERGATDTWEKRTDGTAVRTVTKGKLVRVNPVLDPAYDDSELTVARGAGRPRSRRDSYFGTDAGYDPAVPTDTAYAVEALGAEVCELCDALDYLRENPAGAHVAYATQEVADATAAIGALTAWLAANGALPADLGARAQEKLTEARGSAQSKIPSLSEDARETRLRALTR